MLSRILSRIRRWRRDEEGAMVVEAAMILPTMFAATLATYVFFDAFRNQAINLKAAYTISDALSREDAIIDNNYMINIWQLHRFLTNSRNLTKLRVSVIQYIDDDEDNNPLNGEYHVVWSQNKGGAGDLDDFGLQAMVDDDQIPVMPHEEVLIMVQTWVDHEPIFSIGLEAFSFENAIFTRPRFSPRMVCFSYSGKADGRVCPIGT